MVVHSVNIMVFLLVIMVSLYIAYILKLAYTEMGDGSNGSTKSEELL